MKILTLLFAGIFISSGLFAQYKVGDKVKDFELENTKGEMVSLSDYDDAKGFIVVFTCNTCPFAIKYEERIIALDKKYSKKGYPVVAINPNCIKQKPDDSMEAMKERSKDQGYGFVYLKDYGQKVAKKFGAERTPEIYLLEKKNDGMYLVYTGTIDNNVDDPSKADKHYVEDAVDALLAGNKVDLAQTKAVGCTIKWSE
jgi:peroxiredoxin